MLKLCKMANVKLSATELELVTNADFILTKNTIITKVYDLFGQLNVQYSAIIQQGNALPVEVLKASSKISRGENYEGLPWVMLDNPRCFGTTDVFAIRTMFWWGNFCSITLHLKGKYKELLHVEALQANANGWFVCTNTDEWQHHFRQNNYQPLSIVQTQTLQQLPFIKLAKKIPLNEWDNIEIFCKGTFGEIMEMIALAT